MTILECRKDRTKRKSPEATGDGLTCGSIGPDVSCLWIGRLFSATRQLDQQRRRTHRVWRPIDGLPLVRPQFSGAKPPCRSKFGSVTRPPCAHIANCFARCDVFQSAAPPLATGNLRAFNRNQNPKRRSAFPCATLAWSALLTGSLSKNARASAIEA